MKCEEHKQFNVCLEQEEKDIIKKAAKIIRESIALLDKKDCCHFDHGYADSPDYLGKDSLKTTARILEDFVDIHTME